LERAAHDLVAVMTILAGRPDRQRGLMPIDRIGEDHSERALRGAEIVLTPDSRQPVRNLELESRPPAGFDQLGAPAIPVTQLPETAGHVDDPPPGVAQSHQGRPGADQLVVGVWRGVYHDARAAYHLVTVILLSPCG